MFAVILGAVLIYFISRNQTKKKEAETKRKKTEFEQKRNELKEQYETALQSGDKKVALAKGRDYFSFLRNGQLTIYDEQALTNDLTAMN